MKRLTIAACVAVAFGLPLAAHAQFGGMPSFGGKSNSGGGDIGAQQDSLVRGYVAANKEVLAANALMAEALGLKDEAAASKAAADVLTEGATKDNLEAANKAISASAERITSQLKSTPKLDDAAKTKFGDGLAKLADGTKRYVAMRADVTNFSNGLKSASPMMLPKLQSGSYIVTSFPTSAKNYGTALSSAVSFAQDNKIPVPADALDATKALASI